MNLSNLKNVLDNGLVAVTDRQGRALLDRTIPNAVDAIDEGELMRLLEITDGDKDDKKAAHLVASAYRGGHSNAKLCWAFNQLLRRGNYVAKRRREALGAALNLGAVEQGENLDGFTADELFDRCEAEIERRRYVVISQLESLVAEINRLERKIGYKSETFVDWGVYVTKDDCARVREELGRIKAKHQRRLASQRVDVRAA